MTEPPNSVAFVFSIRFTPQATTTSADVNSPTQNAGPRWRSWARSRSMPIDVSVNAPSRPNEYMSPSSAIWPRVASTTTAGTSTEIAIARWGVPKRWLRSASHCGRNPSRTSARNTW